MWNHIFHPIASVSLPLLPPPHSLSVKISMGQGQADVALAMLRECSRNGDWLCLKNLHLVTSWLPLLEKVSTVYV